MHEVDCGLLPSLSPASTDPLEGLVAEGTDTGTGDEVQQNNAPVQTDLANIGENGTNSTTIDAHMSENALSITSDNTAANGTNAASIEEVFTQFIQEYENLSFEGQHLRDQMEILNTLLDTSMEQNVDLKRQVQELNERLEAIQGLFRAMQFVLTHDGE